MAKRRHKQESEKKPTLPRGQLMCCKCLTQNPNNGSWDGNVAVTIIGGDAFCLKCMSYAVQKIKEGLKAGKIGVKCNACDGKGTIFNSITKNDDPCHACGGLGGILLSPEETKLNK